MPALARLRARSRSRCSSPDAASAMTRSISPMDQPGVGAVARDIAPEQARIGIILRARGDRISQALLLAQLLEQSRRRPAPDRVGEQLRGIGICCTPVRRGAGNGDMRLRALAPPEAVAAGESRRVRCGAAPGGKSAERSLGKVDQPLMLELARADQHQRSRRILRPQPGVQIVRRHGADGFGIAQAPIVPRAARRTPLPGAGRTPGRTPCHWLRPIPAAQPFSRARDAAESKCGRWVRSASRFTPSSRSGASRLR